MSGAVLGVADATVVDEFFAEFFAKSGVCTVPKATVATKIPTKTFELDERVIEINFPLKSIVSAKSASLYRQRPSFCKLGVSLQRRRNPKQAQPAFFYKETDCFSRGFSSIINSVLGKFLNCRKARVVNRYEQNSNS